MKVIHSLLLGVSLAAFALGIPVNASASSAWSGVTTIRTVVTGDSGTNTRVVVATNNDIRLIFDVNTPVGKQYFTMLMAAYLSQRPVQFAYDTAVQSEFGLTDCHVIMQAYLLP